MRCNFLILCQFAARLEGGSPVLAGIFRGIQVAQFPSHLDPFQIACEVEVDPPMAGRSYYLDLVFSDEDGRVLYTTQVELSFQRRPDNGPSFCYLAGPVRIPTPVEKPGIYRFDLLFEGESIGQTRLDVTL